MVPLQLVVGISTTADIQPALPLGGVLIVNNGLGLSVGQLVAELLHLVASLVYSNSTFGQQNWDSSLQPFSHESSVFTTGPHHLFLHSRMFTLSQ